MSTASEHGSSPIGQEADVGKIDLRDLEREITTIKDELNKLAMIGCVPLWSSLVGRLDDLYDRLSSSTSTAGR